ncbi:nudix hydrolase 19, chloroplastic-like [Prosopis cineraria]|uniref:nudix hydrolase 19, chloroplastic-like n=1 Tax=Prosopis cineraria TaxID=364024 RepID=UPI0024104178|nr:nudix hydrolase 19, chloroplastic-like [Prosopis cineraria]XP_054821873.1 nudix hydrolase 19, chloroplastic-like [Prosopis cineraria]
MIEVLPFPSSSAISSIIPASLHIFTLSRAFSPYKASLTTMSINLHPPAYADNTPLSRPPKASDPFSPTGALEYLKFQLSAPTQPSPTPRLKVLPFRNGRPLASSSTAHSRDSQQIWHLGWINLGDLKGLLEISSGRLSGDSLVYVGSCSEDDVVYWAVDVSSESGLLAVLGSKNLCFVDLRSLMVASDWSDLQAMGNLAIAGRARALLEWHNISQFCGHCGEKTVTIEAGRRKQCSKESCRQRIYPRVDPVVIMLVIDRENDSILLGRKSSFVPRMWSCLAGFIEPGESLEEAVRRETWEETGVEVGDVVYHSSQPWPVGPSSMSCQLMVGFFAYAKSLDINVDNKELEDAQWYSREAVREALTVAEYKKAQRTAASKVEQMCKGVEKSHSLTADFNVESGELASMFVPGPHAIAHHLISSWAFQDLPTGIPCR